MVNPFFRHGLIFLIFIPIVVFANDSQSILANRYSVGVDLGVVRAANLGDSTTFPLGFSTFSYSPNNDDIDSIISGISISKILTLSPLYTLQVGLSAHYISTMTAQGTLAQGISPPLYQATYSYKINSYQYLVDAKIRRQFYERLFPYIYLGLGGASNRAYNFSTTVPGYLTLTPEYSNKTTNSFAYSVGLGADYFVKRNLSIGFGYRLINLGKIGLGSGVINTTPVPAKLTISNLYINSILAQLNYFI